MKSMNNDRLRSMIIAEAMNIDRYDHWSYWFMHECAVHAMKGYWSCMKTVDHSYEQALIMHDNVHIHVIMNIIMTPTSHLWSEPCAFSIIFSLRITLCLHSYIFTTIKLPPHIHILKNRVDNMHGTSNSRIHNIQQGLQLASSLLELGWFLFAMLHLSVIPDAPCLCLGVSCTTADCALLLFMMGLPWRLRF